MGGAEDKFDDVVVLTKPTPMLYPHIAYDAATKKLTMNGADLAGIAAEFGTPTYVYSIPRILDNFNRIRAAFEQHVGSVSIHFSLKSNANGAIVRQLLRAGSGVDCVSAGEIYKALAFGCPPEHVVFAGVGKSREEIDYAVEQRIGWFNVENEDELRLINDACRRLGTQVNVALRVNPDVKANTHPSIATGHGGAKFGLPIATVESLLSSRGAASAYDRVVFAGLHVHIGSQLGDLAPTVDAVDKVAHLCRRFGLGAINIGGGFPAQYRPSDSPDMFPSPEAFAAAVAPLVRDLHVMLEPGRSVVADAGVLLTRSLYRKDQNGLTMLIIDASMVEVIRPALYHAYHDVVPTVDYTSSTAEPPILTTVVGPVCESTDIICRGLLLHAECVRPGELFAVMTTGAYCSSMASNYNARPLCAEVAVLTSGHAALCRRRQTFADLLRDEVDVSI